MGDAHQHITYFSEPRPGCYCGDLAVMSVNSRNYCTRHGQDRLNAIANEFAIRHAGRPA